MFITQFDRPRRIYQDPGNGVRVLYTSKLQDDGTIDLIPSGTEDLYSAIQSHKDSCDIHVLLARYQNGDPDVLSRAQGAYGDFTNMPTTYAELLNSMIAGENYFNSLPVETRAKFGHSFEQFMLSMDDMSGFLEKLGVQQVQGSEDPSPLTSGEGSSEPAKMPEKEDVK